MGGRNHQGVTIRQYLYLYTKFTVDSTVSTIDQLYQLAVDSTVGIVESTFVTVESTAQQEHLPFIDNIRFYC